MPEPPEFEAESVEEAGVDPCGCNPRRSPSAQSGTVPPAAKDGVLAVPGRILKLVLRVAPKDGAYQALLSVGADGCDPELRVYTVTDIEAALRMFPDLVTSAEQRWQTRPRYPSITRQTSDSLSSSKPARAHPSAAPNVPPRSTVLSASAGESGPNQLDLFG
jgi:hypothetical protein